MKKYWYIFLVVLASLMLTPRAAAEGAYFGVRAEMILPLGVSNVSLTIPLPGLQLGYDFGGESEPGFGVRATLSSLIFVSKVSIDAMYRIPTDSAGSGWYVGGGADLVLVLSSSVGNPFGVHVVAGFAVPLAESVGFFVEASPGLLFLGGGDPLAFLSVVLGVNFYL